MLESSAPLWLTKRYDQVCTEAAGLTSRQTNRIRGTHRDVWETSICWAPAWSRSRRMAAAGLGCEGNDGRKAGTWCCCAYWRVGCPRPPAERCSCEGCALQRPQERKQTCARWDFLRSAKCFLLSANFCQTHFHFHGNGNTSDWGDGHHYHC